MLSGPKTFMHISSVFLLILDREFSFFCFLSIFDWEISLFSLFFFFFLFSSEIKDGHSHVRMSILDLGRKQKKKEKKREKRNFPIKNRKKTKERKFPIKDQKKNRRNMHKGLWTRQHLNNIELSPSKQKKERKPRPKVVLSL